MSRHLPSTARSPLSTRTGIPQALVLRHWTARISTLVLGAGRVAGGRGHRWRFRLFITGIGACLTLSLVASAGATGISGPAERSFGGRHLDVRQGAVPPALFADLAHIDKLLSKLIGDVRSGNSGGGAQTIDRIAEIERAKRAMVTASFDQPIYGLKFSEVFFGLDCLDQNLGHARGVIVGTPGAEVTARVADDIARGQKCKQQLENKLLHRAGLPRDLLPDLKHIDKLLSKLIGDVRSGNSGGGAQTIDRIAEIERAKRAMVTASFDQPIYGLKFSEVFFGLDCLDQNLGHARGVIVGTPGAEVTARVADDIARGQKCKQQLENKLRSASPPPSKALSTSPIRAVFSEPDRATTYSVPTIEIGR